MAMPRKKINRKRGLKQGENKRPEEAKKNQGFHPSWLYGRAFKPIDRGDRVTK
jgi:hypothetical protein